MVCGSDDDAQAGAAWIFTRTAGAWSQQGTKLVGTGAAIPSWQGWSGSLSADGNTAAVGGYFDNGGEGGVWVYTRSVGVWSQQGAKLWGFDAAGTARQGQSVSLSADGSTLIVGGNVDNTNIGAAWIFTP